MLPLCRLLANLYSGNVYIWSTADQVRQSLFGSSSEGGSVDQILVNVGGT